MFSRKNIWGFAHFHCLIQLLNCIRPVSENKLCLVDFCTLDMGKLVPPARL